MNQTSNQLLQFKQSINEHLLNKETKEVPELLKLQHVFDFLQKNLAQIGKNVLLADVLPILRHSIRLAELTSSNAEIQIRKHLWSLFFKTQNAEREEIREVCLENSLQILYQILQTLTPEQQMDLDDSVFQLLIKMLPEIPNKSLKANALECLRLYVRKFKATSVLLSLWLQIESKLIADNDETLQVLLALFDDFAGCVEIPNFKTTLKASNLIEDLIKHDEHDKRKCAYFLLKKSFSFFNEGDTQFWTTCINIFENLEENQSHLILPSLQFLNRLTAKNSSNESSKWLNILLYKILRHQNILVRRWVLEYFLSQLTFGELLSTENACQFLQASNESALYNIEGYMLPVENFERFLPIIDGNFFKIFSQINWKAVPLHYWLTQLMRFRQNFDFSDATKNVKILLALATKVRALQNVRLRRQIIQLFNEMFADFIAAKMNLLDYVELIRTLYNVTDAFVDFGLLNQKLASFTFENQNHHHHNWFDQRFYEIITNHHLMMPTDGGSLKNSFDNLILVKFEAVQIIDSQTYLSLFIIFELQENLNKIEFCKRNFDLDLISLGKIEKFADFYDLLEQKFASAVVNKIFLKRRAMDFYICNSSYINNFEDILNMEELKLEELLSTGSSVTLLRVTNLLAAHKVAVEHDVLDDIFNSLHDYTRFEHVCFECCINLMKYFKSALEPSSCAHWAQKLLHLDLENSAITDAVLLNANLQLNDEKLLLQGALNSNTKTGDCRIEQVYLSKCKEKEATDFHTRRAYVHQITKLESRQLQQSILLQACELAKKLNLKKPRYFSHSQEHRMLIRLTFLMWNLRHTVVDDETSSVLFQKLWSLLMEHNNQPNVTIIYECLIAHYADLPALLEAINVLKKQRKLTSSQEVAVIMLCYRYFEAKFKATASADIADAITFLWPLTMGSSFQTRLHAQLAVLALIARHEKKLETEKSTKNHEPTFLALKTAIEEMIGAVQVKEFLQDVRFLPTNHKDFYNQIMFMTQTPFDEYKISAKYFATNPQISPAKKLLEMAKGTSTSAPVKLQTEQSNTNGTADVQRKLNPFADFMPQPNLVAYPAAKESELYVIASLIDKIPNLGGIARTCEVLGIQNLVLASKADTTKADFKNLSMTAETTLNLIEVKPLDLPSFIMEKKCAGFCVIGAEQTANSCSFADFKFPKRCLLILGHEKEGIPPSLLNFLDRAVEIPQFGVVRSLNVHVTGALFMWEYCKQHICTNI